jgi:hypothetical protein
MRNDTLRDRGRYKQITVGAVFLTLFFAGTARADCPDANFICPSGESLSVGLCWSWDSLQCYTCSSIEVSVRSKCQRPLCDNIENWFGRQDGCSTDVLNLEVPVLGTIPFGDPLKEFGRAACNIHDLCYGTFGRTKEECDLNFQANLVQTCFFPGTTGGLYGRLLCPAVAEAMYAAVALFPDADFGYASGQAFASRECTGAEELVSGDFNGDGVDDLAIGVSQAVSDTGGRVKLVYGQAGSGLTSAPGQTYREPSPEQGDRFGGALASGDFNGDGFDDLAAGAPGKDLQDIHDAGRVSIFVPEPSSLLMLAAGVGCLVMLYRMRG